MDSDGKSLTVVPAKRRMAAKEANQLLSGSLEPWEEKHCRWLAELEGRNVPYLDQAFVCSQPDWANREVSVGEIKKLRDKRTWRNLKYELRAARKEYADQARSIINETLPKAARLHERAIDEMLDAVLPDGKPKPLDLRAVPSLTIPYIERAFPKKIESTTVSTKITINLSADQLRGLNSPVSVVEAEDAEVISIEDAN